MAKNKISWEEMTDIQRKEETIRACREFKNARDKFIDWMKGKEFGQSHEIIRQANARTK